MAMSFSQRVSDSIAVTGKGSGHILKERGGVGLLGGARGYSFMFSRSRPVQALLELLHPAPVRGQLRQRAPAHACASRARARPRA